MADVVPMVSYENCAAAADWLVHAFGFVEEDRYEEDGEVTHVTLGAGDGTIFLGQPGATYVNPERLREESELVAQMYGVPWVLDGVWVRVDDWTLTSSERAPPARRSSPSRRRAPWAGSTAPRISRGTAGCSPRRGSASAPATGGLDAAPAASDACASESTRGRHLCSHA